MLRDSGCLAQPSLYYKSPPVDDEYFVILLVTVATIALATVVAVVTEDFVAPSTLLVTVATIALATVVAVVTEDFVAPSTFDATILLITLKGCDRRITRFVTKLAQVWVVVERVVPVKNTGLANCNRAAERFEVQEV